MGHVESMEEHRLTKRITEWKFTAFTERGKHKIKLEDDIKQDLKVMKIYIWKRQVKIVKNGNESFSITHKEL